MMRASIIVPHYNDKTRLRTGLNALVPQVTGRSDVEILVVDNDSPVDLSDIRSDFPGVRLIVEQTKGAASARNRGVAESSGEYLFFIDADCVAAPDWVESALRLAGSSDVIGGRVDTLDETPPPRSGAEAFEAVFAFNQKKYIEEKGFSGSGNLLTSRAIFQDVGGFSLGRSEDIDWCWRATAKGYTLTYADDLLVYHPTRADWPQLKRKWLRVTDEMFGLRGSSALSRLNWLLRAGVVALSPLPHSVKLLTSPILNGPTERVRGLATLVRLRMARAGRMVRQSLAG